MKVLTSGKLFTFRGITYQVKKSPGHGSSSCQYCERNCIIVSNTALCTFCSEYIGPGYYPSRIRRKDDYVIQFRVKSVVDTIRRMETNEVIERLKRFGSFVSSGINSEYLHIFKKPVPVTIQNYPFNGYTKVRAVAYRPAFKNGPIYTVGLYAKHDEKELIGETIITEHVSKFCPGDTIRIALAIK